jgi:hypothetical protein
MTIVRRNSPAGSYSVVELSGTPQRRSKLFFDATRCFGGHTDVRALSDEFLAGVAHALDECIVDVEVTAILADRRSHRRRLAKQPLVIIDTYHRASLYDIS